jgi:hypothetical protein
MNSFLVIFLSGFGTGIVLALGKEVEVSFL